MLLPLLLNPEQVRTRLGEVPGSVLAAVEYGARSASAIPALHVHVPLRTGGEQRQIELWPAKRAATRETRQGVAVSHDGELLFGAIPLRGIADGARLEETTRIAYAAITDACRDLEYPYPLRVWNFIPGIHEMHEGLDRYQSFCRARHEPLARYLEGIGDRFPAATVVGTRTDEGVLYFLAAKRPGRHLENPRQLPPPDYPDRYGPCSPSFSRATLATLNGESALYISGTASIVGHESRHPYDTGRQAEEVLCNLEELIQTAARTSGLAFSGLRDIVHARVFLRELADAPGVADRLRNSLGVTAAIGYHEGDLCRRELLIEIEGIAVPATAPGVALGPRSRRDSTSHVPVAVPPAYSTWMW
jgi:chorismate lyase/3-hydroxybenzoate synthase